MTLVVGLRGSDGLVLAADSRGTYGDPRGVTAQNDSIVKLHRLSAYAGVLMAGDGGLGNQVLATWPEDKNAKVSTPDLVERFRQHTLAQFGAWFPGFLPFPIQSAPVPVRPSVSFIIGGYEYDPANDTVGAPVLYALTGPSNFAPMRIDHGFALEGVAQYALYLFNRLYREGYSTDHLKSLAAYAITETAMQDGKVGGSYSHGNYLTNERLPRPRSPRNH